MSEDSASLPRQRPGDRRRSMKTASPSTLMTSNASRPASCRNPMRHRSERRARCGSRVRRRRVARDRDRQRRVVAQRLVVRAADPVDDLVRAGEAGVRRVDDRADRRRPVGGPRDDLRGPGIADVVRLDVDLDGLALARHPRVGDGDRVDRHRDGARRRRPERRVVAALDREGVLAREGAGRLVGERAVLRRRSPCRWPAPLEIVRVTVWPVSGSVTATAPETGTVASVVTLASPTVGAVLPTVNVPGT